MIDFNWSKSTIESTLLCLVLFLLYVALYYKNNRKFYEQKVFTANSALFIYSLILVVYICIDTDWYSYQSMVHNYDLTNGAQNYGEPIYGFIIKLVDRNYLLFRIIVWGGAFLFSVLTFKRLGLDTGLAIFFLIAVFLLKFNYARASLGMGLYFLGFSYFVKPSKLPSLLNYLLSLLLMFAAYQFHTSCQILIPLTFSIFIPIKRKTILLGLIIVPIIGYILKGNIVGFINSSGIESNEYIYNKINGYIERESESRNLMGVIYDIIQYGAFFLPVIANALVITSNKLKSYDIESYVIKTFRFTICLVLFSLIFLFMDLSSPLFFYRLLYMAIIPLTILTVYLFQKGVMDLRVYNFIVILGIISNLYRILYTLYKL